MSIKKILLVATIILTQPIAFVRAGMVSPVIHFSAGTNMINDGEFIAEKEIALRAGQVFGGTGLLKSPKIEISTRKFTFTGTIDCSGTCVIRAEEPFDVNMFKRKGGGEFVIIIEPLKPDNDHDQMAAAERRMQAIKAGAKAASDRMQKEMEEMRSKHDRQWRNFQPPVIEPIKVNVQEIAPQAPMPTQESSSPAPSESTTKETSTIEQQDPDQAITAYKIGKAVVINVAVLAAFYGTIFGSFLLLKKLVRSYYFA